MVLLVDDDPEFLQSVKHALSDTDVMMAGTVREALDLIDVIRFEAALVDLNLSDESGFELIDQIHTQTPALPIIAISGVVGDAALESAKSFGALRILRKPATPDWQAVVEQVRIEA